MSRINRRTFAISSASAAAFTASIVGAQDATPVASPEATPVEGGMQARLVDYSILPNDLMVDGTLYGGISGIDFDASTETWYMISDDRSDVAPSRFYEATIEYDDNGFTNVTIDRAVTLLQEDGSPFPNQEEGGLVVDPEAIRVDPHGDKLWWTSEGIQNLELQPFVSVSNLDGSLDSIIEIPGLYQTTYPEVSGPRDNHNFEGLTFSPDGETLWVGLEHPLYQDGLAPSPDNNSFVRLVNIDRSGTVLQEFAVELDSIDAPDDSQYLSMGMSEILALDDHRFLAVVRTTIADKDWQFENYIRIWVLDTRGATNLLEVDSLVDAEFTPVSRQLLIDLNDAGLFPIDNIEAMAFGPNLPNGNRALILTNDNNFDFETQVQQVVLLEVSGE